MATGFSLKDHLFNETTVGRLAREYAAALPQFDGPRFKAEALAGFPDRELMARMEWMADCLEPQLATDFPTLADQLEAALPAPLDPALRDDDFGHFIHALPGILAVRHGLEDHHRDRALDLLHAATRRFTMEFYIRPFLNRWPSETLARLTLWSRDENYHVRRLVSEGTRPRLPWARAVTLSQAQTLPLLNRLYADPTRYVTRSVANHLNDIAKIDPDLVVATLARWTAEARQDPSEMAWITRHALRTLVKQGHPGALELLGYRGDVPVTAKLSLGAERFAIGAALTFEVTLTAAQDLAAMVDYRVTFHRPNGRPAEKVFKLRAAALTANTPLRLKKKHPLKGNATSFTLHPGAHRIVVQVNGRDLAEATFELI